MLKQKHKQRLKHVGLVTCANNAGRISSLEVISRKTSRSTYNKNGAKKAKTMNENDKHNNTTAAAAIPLRVRLGEENENVCT